MSEWRTASPIKKIVSSGFALALLVAAANFPGRAQHLFESTLPITRLWPDGDAQYRLQLSEVPYDLLRVADAVLPPDATVLLVTPGLDVRHLEYTTFHRALYFLTPRPVWWLSPAPSDGTWESRWWISAPLTVESLLAVAAEKGASYVLAYGLSQPLAIGRTILERSDGFLVQLNDTEPYALDQSLRPQYAGSLWPIQLALAIALIVLLGHVALSLIGRLGYQPARIEALALAWALGAGLTSIGMWWLNVLSVPLNGQLVILTLLAIGGWLWNWRFRIHVDDRPTFLRSRPVRPETVGVIAEMARQAGCVECGRDWPPFHLSRRLILFLLILLFVAAHVAYVSILAAGRPLDIWDSWVTWGMKARAIFLDGGLSPAAYTEPSRAVTHLDYPLLVPLVEAWLYAWLGAPDDRFAGVMSISFYLALLGICYATARRSGASVLFAASATAVVATMASLALWASLVFADVPLAVFATLATVYLFQWLDNGTPGTLIIAALAAGLMIWTKREGAILLVALCASVFLTSRDTRRAMLAVSALIVAALLVAGPWWIFLAGNGIANTDFSPISLATFQGNLIRLPNIVRMMLGSLLSINWSYIWPVCALLALSLASRRAMGSGVRPAMKATSHLFWVSSMLYLGLMSLGYVFSAYVPYQQHVASSVDRLVAHVAPLPVLWLAYRGCEAS